MWECTMLYTQLCRKNSRARCCSQISTFTQKDTILIDCYIGSLLSQHQKGSSKGDTFLQKFIQCRNQMFKMKIFKNLFGKSHAFFWVSPTPARSSATVPPLVPVVVPSLGLSSLSFCKTWKKVTPMPCVWAAQQMHWNRVSRSHFLYILLSLFRHVLAFLEGETTGLVCRFRFPAMWSDQAQDSHFSDFVSSLARQSNGASHLGGTGGKCWRKCPAHVEPKAAVSIEGWKIGGNVSWFETWAAPAPSLRQDVQQILRPLRQGLKLWRHPEVFGGGRLWLMGTRRRPRSQRSLVSRQCLSLVTVVSNSARRLSRKPVEAAACAAVCPTWDASAILDEEWVMDDGQGDIDRSIGLPAHRPWPTPRRPPAAADAARHAQRLLPLRGTEH